MAGYLMTVDEMASEMVHPEGFRMLPTELHKMRAEAHLQSTCPPGRLSQHSIAMNDTSLLSASASTSRRTTPATKSSGEIGSWAYTNYAYITASFPLGLRAYSHPSAQPPEFRGSASATRHRLL